MVDVIGTSFDDVLEGPFPNPGTDGGDRLFGLAGNDQLYGQEGPDRLEGGEGNDILDGENSSDALYGGPGDDIYFAVEMEGEFDFVTEYANEGVDTIYWYTLFGNMPANVENAVLMNPRGQINGNDLPNVITGNDGPNRLTSVFGGVDRLIGLGGDDTYAIDGTDIAVEVPNQGIDTIEAFVVNYMLPVNFENLVGLLGGVLTGNAAANRITSSGATHDTLDGGSGADFLAGGAGNDLYLVDNQQDTVLEGASAGFDTVRSSVNFTLSSNVEVLELTGLALIGRGSTGDNTVRGNAQVNLLEGFAGHDTLDGKAGDDRMFGGVGNDIYIVDHAGELLAELQNEGSDNVFSSVSWTLGANFEWLNLTGLGNLAGTGNELNNVLIGNAGANVLNGLAGADFMQGGLGNDIYFADDELDFVSELGNQGIDTVNASARFILGSDVENLNLTGALGIDGYGNALANRITGNVAPNRLDGQAGADVMSGGGGNDTYVVDNVNDVTYELTSAGIDAVVSTITWTLAASVERLFLSGMAAIDATGNNLVNYLAGNGAANRLDGRAGADVMAGGGGSDIYVVDNPGDFVDEALNEGVDTVQSVLSWTLALNLENLTLLGGANAIGTGNALPNRLTGNAGANTLSGLESADTIVGGDSADVLIGGLGVDMLTGGLGADRFQFANAAQGWDDITDFAAGQDDLVVDASAFGGGLIAGALAANRLVVGPVLGFPAANQAFGQFLYDRDDGRLYWDVDGTGAAGPVIIARLSNLVLISAPDFVVLA